VAPTSTSGVVAATASVSDGTIDTIRRTRDGTGTALPRSSSTGPSSTLDVSGRLMPDPAGGAMRTEGAGPVGGA
jgi:hypothetical protein